MAGDDFVDAIHTAITEFNCIFIDDFVEFVFWWKHMLRRLKKMFLCLWQRFYYYEGLNKVIFLLLLLSLLIYFILLFFMLLGGLMFS